MGKNARGKWVATPKLYIRSARNTQAQKEGLGEYISGVLFNSAAGPAPANAEPQIGRNEASLDAELGLGVPSGGYRQGRRYSLSYQQR